MKKLMLVVALCVSASVLFVACQKEDIKSSEANTQTASSREGDRDFTPEFSENCGRPRMRVLCITPREGNLPTSWDVNFNFRGFDANNLVKIYSLYASQTVTGTGVGIGEWVEAEETIFKTSFIQGVQNPVTQHNLIVSDVYDDNAGTKVATRVIVQLDIDGKITTYSFLVNGSSCTPEQPSGSFDETVNAPIIVTRDCYNTSRHSVQIIPNDEYPCSEPVLCLDRE